jgi:Family of unknown function (DUF5764)
MYFNNINMDDFVISNLNESRNEWCSRLVSIFTPLVIEGVKSIFNESWKLCLDNDEVNKYLMTFQNLLSRVPKWNNEIIEEERKRIVERSGCNYLEDLITCVHVIQLKVLTCIRVGNKQKKIDISIPKLDTFIHKIYINTARKVYSNVYLFEKNISPLQTQKNNRELELIVQECILSAIRDSIPTESIIRAYMDESVEQEEEVTIENIEDTDTKTETEPESEKEPEKKEEEYIEPVVPSIKNINDEPVTTRLTFNNVDTVLENNVKKEIEAPKSLERLEELSTSNAIQRKLEEDEDSDRIQIYQDQPFDLSEFDLLDEVKPSKPSDDVFLDDIEEL